MSSLGKIGNKLKDHLKVAKDTVLNLELNLYNNTNINTENNENINKESKMSELFDLPKINNNNSTKKINSEINNKNELKDIISELSK